MNSNDKTELQVEEDTDGSAVVQLPGNEAPPQTEEPSAQQDDDDLSSDNSDEPGDTRTDSEREAIREARREERRLKKQLHKEKARESNHLIAALRKQNNELAERLSVIERKTSAGDLARVEKAIEDTAVQVEYAKMKMSEAVRVNDGDALAKAQEMWYDSQRKLESLKGVKQAATREPQQPIKAPDPLVQRMARDWMDRNSWYDPNGKDLDSEIAMKIDKRLTDEGFDPASEEYWDELDDRLKKYLPHKANTGYNGNTSNQRPRSMMTGSGRETIATTRSNEFRLSPDRVAAMKEAGLWDNPDLRAKAIRNYANWDRQNKMKG